MHFYDFVANSASNYFLPTSKHWPAKVRHFLGICLCDCFIYLSNFVFRKCLETRRHLYSGRKTVNSQMIFRVTAGDQNARKLLFTDLVNTNLLYPVKWRQQYRISPGKGTATKNHFEWIIKQLLDAAFVWYEELCSSQMVLWPGIRR